MDGDPSPPQSPGVVLLELSQILTDKARDIRRMADREQPGHTRESSRSLGHEL